MSDVLTVEAEATSATIMIWRTGNRIFNRWVGKVVVRAKSDEHKVTTDYHHHPVSGSLGYVRSTLVLQVEAMKNGRTWNLEGPPTYSTTVPL